MDTIMLRYEGGGGLINSHGSCGNNPGLFINQHFCLVLFPGLPASSSCSMLSQHTALTLSYNTEGIGSPLRTSHEETSTANLCVVCWK